MKARFALCCWNCAKGVLFYNRTGRSVRLEGQNIGKTADELVQLWNEEHPDDQVAD
jgi:hypothetical protein